MASIDNVRSGQSLTNTSRNSTRTEHNTSSSEKVNHPSDKKDAVSLSSQSKAMGEIHSKLASSPAFDSAKVEAIKEAIANGSYRVDADKLADNMIKFEKELDGLQ
ncbi:flagellar biosynthesis anti-sigma factor FlgM [Vibrio rhizosphaerae]|uniref:Negative regulator of flagellin synthesis n=1 Tax=Vibrio rhizosphaerae TaxID=398736 RepID=A0ABU4IWS7_9VIBR|nr:flagellar biosynthesis anti-sigma factor FlgM [Vibrio rhizosphaerae]MDW6093582.1 flagellar biosynthesis anti-sigma factor FlgM [Vibrio rhizosphaerae]